jgi:hypothetical protein
VIKDAGLVVDRRAGKRRIYRLDPEGLGALRADLERFWSKALAAYKTAVEQPTEEDRMSTGSRDDCAQLDRGRSGDRARLSGLHRGPRKGSSRPSTTCSRQR